MRKYILTGNAILLSFFSFYYYKSYKSYLQTPYPITQMTNYPLKTKQQHLQSMITNPHYDVLVIGGGCNGAGVALDAASRGLRVLLIEKQDFSSGASSKSTKLAHGGMRYLPKVFSFSLYPLGQRWTNLQLIKSSIGERSNILQNSSYLSNVLLQQQKIELVIPCKGVLEAIYYWLGTLTHHFIYFWVRDKNSHQKFNLPYLIFKKELEQEGVSINKGFKYGIVFSDGQFDDARLNLDILLTSTIHNYLPNMIGSTILSYSEIKKFKKSLNGQIVGAQIQDNLTNQCYNITCKVAVNCTGCFVDEIRKLDEQNVEKINFLTVGGSHISFPKSINPNSKRGLCIFTQNKKILFFLPFKSNFILGTTEQKYDQPILHPIPSEKQYNYLINQAAKVLKYDSQKLMNMQQGKYSGIISLVFQKPQKKQGKIKANNISKGYYIYQNQSGLISLFGGKWTAYRQIAQQITDKICNTLNYNQKSKTQHLKLLGQPNYKDKYYHSSIISQRYQIQVQDAFELYCRYGKRIIDVLEYVKKENMVKVQNVFLGQIKYLIEKEHVVGPYDLLVRRLRIGILDRNKTVKLIPVVIHELGIFNKWTQQQQQKNLDKAIQQLFKFQY